MGGLEGEGVVLQADMVVVVKCVGAASLLLNVVAMGKGSLQKIRGRRGRRGAWTSWQGAH